MKKTWLQALAALILALLIVMVLDRLTNRLDPANNPGHVWDYIYYIDMAQNGVWGNAHLVSPYAYRFVTPLLAALINAVLHTPVYFGFKILAYAGLVPALWGVYLIARHFRTSFAAALVVMTIPGLALFQIKFLLFDFYRPDQLAYPLMVFAILAMLNRRYWIAAALSLVGLFVREFMIIPIPILLYIFWQEWRKDRHRLQPVVWAAALILMTGMVVILPRLIIPVVKSQQWFDPFHDRHLLQTVLRITLDPNRDLNVLFNLLAYGLPLLLLATPRRLKRAWQALGGYRAWVLIYSAVCMFEMMYGGADLERFATFFIIPQVFLLIFILKQGVSTFELAYLLAAMVIFNRLLYPFPIWDFSAYLNFYGGYGDTVNANTWMRYAELGMLLAGGWLLRWLWWKLPWAERMVLQGSET